MKRVLVAEDYESLRELLRYLLEQEQYEVHLAGDGYEAVGLMRQGVFDAVITDWDMPRMNGLKFLALSRIMWPKTPIIIISAEATPFPEGLPSGAFAWLNKPFRAEELLEVLRTAIWTTVHRHLEQSLTATSQP
ncbi:MAG: response regulator [Nitrospirota bacterium]